MQMLKDKRGKWLARDYVIATVLFSGIIALFVLSIDDLAEQYDAPANVTDEKFSRTFDRFENDTLIARKMWNETRQKGEGGISTVGTYTLLFKGTFGVINLVFQSVSQTGSQMFGFVEYFGIPSEVGFIFFTLIGTILFIAIVFIIISSITQREL